MRFIFGLWHSMKYRCIDEWDDVRARFPCSVIMGIALGTFATIAIAASLEGSGCVSIWGQGVCGAHQLFKAKVYAKRNASDLGAYN